MITPALTFWWHLFATLAVEVCCLTVLGFVAQRLARSALGRRAAWQVTVVCLLAAAASEWTGVGRAMAMHLAPRAQAVENKPALKISPSQAGHTVEAQFATLSPHPPENQAVAIGWPGLIGLAGTVLLLGRTALAQGLLLALRFGRNQITDGPLQQRVAHLSPRLGLRQRVCLQRMSALLSPMAFGIFRPCIGLPAKFETRLSPAEQDAVLAHELAHLAARDPLWFLLADLAVAVLWWHPMAWWARQRLHVISEQAADEATALVPDGPRALAQCLVSLGKEMADMGAWGWVGINGGGFRSHLGRRVEGLLQLSGEPKPPLHGRGARTIKIAALLAAAPLTVLAFGSMQTTQGPSDETWWFQLEKSWRQSPAGMLLLAKRDDQAKTPKDGGNKTDEGVWMENIRPVKPAGSGAIEITNIVLVARGINRTNQQDLAFTVAQFLTNSPSVTNLATPPLRKQLIIQDAKFLYAMGKLDEAETIFKKVLLDDPSNRSAPYFLDLIKEARYLKKARTQAAAAQQHAMDPRFVDIHRGRQRILSLLDTIMFDEVSYPDLPLKEIVKRLQTESVRHDPEGKGVNFMINHQDAGVSNGLSWPTHIGTEVMIRISPPMKNVRLSDELEAITKTADHPIYYSVQDDAVVFSSNPAETNALYTKIFHVNPNAFEQAIKNVRAVTSAKAPAPIALDIKGAATNSPANIHQMVRDYFTGVGVDLTPPKMIFWNDRLGELLVKASLKDLETIQELIELVNQSPLNKADADSK